jgi:copper resistance protein B
MTPCAKFTLLGGALALLTGSSALGAEPPDMPSDSLQAALQSLKTQPFVPPTPNYQPTAGESAHVPPPPPQHPISDMPSPQVEAMMKMDDKGRTGMFLLDQLEWRNTAEGNAVAWDTEGWYGGDNNKVWLRSEGEGVDGTAQNARADLLWDHTFARWWSVQAGGRQDFGAGPARTWAAIGVQGLAPYWFNTEATFYVGEQGRTAARLKSEYELLFTQRLVLQPEAEANLYGKPDPARQLGSGLSDLEIGLRLRYEVRRELAPYIGVVWSRQFGGTADRVRETGGNPSDVQFVVGVRAWF